MVQNRLTTAALFLVFSLASSPVPASLFERGATYYFNQADQFLPEAIDELRALLRAADKSCTRIEECCEPAQKVLEMLFGDTVRTTLPDVIVYIEKQDFGELATYGPLLLWKDENTPYLYGARHIYVLVISDVQLSLGASLTTIVEKVANPFAGVLTLLKFAPAEPSAPEPKSHLAAINWTPLGKGSGGPFVGRARLDVEVGSVNRLTLFEREETVSRTIKQGSCTGCGTTEVVRKAEGPEPLPGEGAASVPFRSITAHISNSRPSYAGLGVALGATFGVEGTALGEDGGEVHENAYALAKVYVVRPRLQVGPKKRSLYRPSWALVFGTNVTNDPFEELVGGVSLGHVIGNLGLTVGVNWVKPAKPVEEGAGGEGGREASGRESKIFVGVDYSF